MKTRIHESSRKWVCFAVERFECLGFECLFPEKYLAKAVMFFDVAIAQSAAKIKKHDSWRRWFIRRLHVETVRILILTVCFLVKTRNMRAGGNGCDAVSKGENGPSFCVLKMCCLTRFAQIWYGL